MQGTSGDSSQVNIIGVKACLGIALRCVHPDTNRRPYIKDIVNELDELESMIEKMSLSTEQSKDRQIGLQV